MKDNLQFFRQVFLAVSVWLVASVSLGASSGWTTQTTDRQNNDWQSYSVANAIQSDFGWDFNYTSTLQSISLNAPLAEGETCDDPIQIMILPFEDSGNTSTYGAGYTIDDVPPVASDAVTNGTGSEYYITGDAVVYALTATNDGTITINTTNDDDWVGLWAFTGCPFSSTVGYHTSTGGATRSIPDLPVTAGETYYIVISTWPSPQSTDYTIEVTGSDGVLAPLEDCDGTPDGGIAHTNPEEGNAGSDYSVSSSGYTLGNELSFQWQSNTEDAGWIDEGEEMDAYASHSATAPEELGVTVEWRLRVTCNISGETAYSEVATFTTIIEYCQPSFSSTSDYIESFILEDIENLNSGFSPGGYGDFTDMSTVLVLPNYEATLTASSGSGNHGASIWIDANDNGTFEESERVGSLSDIAADQTVQIPMDITGMASGEHRMRVVYQYNVAGDVIDPCVSSSWGEAEDYTIIIGELDDCAGTPDAGTISVTPSSGNANSQYTVKSSGYTYGNGLTYQWQSNKNDEGWNDEGDELDIYQAFEATADGEVGDTIDWRLIVTCNNSGETSTSDTATFTITIEYCTPTYTTGCSSNDNIINVTLPGEGVTLDNDSGCSPGAYADYTGDDSVEVPDLVPGGEYTLSVTTGYSSPTSEQVRAWIDWNNDGTFTEDEMIADTNGAGLPESGTGHFDFIVPTNAVDGELRMRVRLVWGTSAVPEPCGSATYGEAEDYLVMVGELVDCSGTPDTGTVTVNPENGNINSSYTVKSSGYTFGNGLTYQWQSNTDDAGWVDEGDLMDGYSSFNATAPSEFGSTVDWRLIVTCTLSGETSTSNTATFTVGDDLIYCEPGGTNPSYFINNFSTTGANVNISNLNSGFSPGGYGDFYDSHMASQISGESINFSTDISGGTAGFRIWVDWNHDGIFSPNEVMFASSGYAGSHSGSFEVPDDAMLGETRMRVVSHYLNSTGDIDPCEPEHIYGEFEDYKFLVGELEDCDGTPDPGTISVTPETGNAGMEYVVASSGYTYGNGLTYQWQSNLNDGGWEDEGDSTDLYSDYTATAPGEVGDSVDWRLVITCANSGESATSNIATFEVDRLHCTPGGTNSTYYINNFSTTGGEENISNLNSGFSPGGYGNFYDTHEVQQAVGQTVNFSTSFEGGTFGFKIWIDWNQDGTFSADEVAFVSNSYETSYSGSFTVPFNAAPGETRMRIVNHWLSTTADVDPCETNHIYGEFEDYKFIVEELEDCEGTPDPGTVSVTPSGGSTGSEYTVSSTGFTYGNGLTYQWQSNLNDNGWVDQGAATEFYQDYHATAPGNLGDTVDWRLVVTCNLSGETGTSNVATFTVNSIYCTPEGTNSDYYINNFTTSNGMVDISNLNSGFSPNGYGNFYDEHMVQQVAGETIDFSAEFEGGTFGFRVWVDWNQDGMFSADEVAFASSSYQTSHSGTITVPQDAVPGETRMRIVNHWLSTNADVDPCEPNHIYGEFEDYKFAIGEPEPCEGTPDAGTISVDPPFGNPGSTYLVKSSGFTFATDLTFQWQSNTEGAGWVDEGDLLTTYAHHTAVAPNQPNMEVDWRLIVTCLNSGESDTSDAATFTTIMPGCGHETPSNDLEDAHGNLHALEFANDFTVNVNQQFLIQTISLNIVLPIGVPVDAADFNFYKDSDGNGPGELVDSDLGVAPSSSNMILNAGNNFGLYQYVFNISDVLLDGNDTMEEIYWVGVKIDTDADSSYWEVTSNINSDNEEYILINDEWVSSTTQFGDPFDGVMEIHGMCTTLDTNLAEVFDFTYYPNPVKDILNIQSGKTIESVSVYNLSGQQMMSLKDAKVQNGKLDITQLNPGVYVIRAVLEGGQVETFKIIKK